MSNEKDSERVIKRARAETQRLFTAIEKAEGSDVRKAALREQAVARYQKICDESPTQFSSFLKLMNDKSPQSTRILAAMEGYLLNKVSSIITQLRESPNIGSEDKALFENLRLLAKLDEKFKEAIFTELNKPKNIEKMGVLVSHLLSHAVFSQKQVEKKFPNTEPSVQIALLIDKLMKSKTSDSRKADSNKDDSKKDDTKTISERVAEIKKLAESDASARGVLLSSLMSLGYATNRNIEGLTGKLMSLILPEDRENALTWNHQELSAVLDHMSQYVAKDDPSKNLYDWGLVDIVEVEVKRLSSEAGLGGAHSTTSTVDTIDKAGKTKRTGDDIAKEFVGSLVGIGIKPDIHTSRWAAVTGNLFEGGNVKFGDMMLDCAKELNIIRLNPDRKITDVNWSRALNPFVLAEYVFLGLEVGVKRVGVLFGEHTTARSFFQAPFVAILRTPRIVLELLGRATSVGGVPDRYGDAKKGEEIAVANYKGKMQTFSFDKHANTQWAIDNFMYTNRKEGAYSNVKTAYDEQISQLLVSRKNNSNDSKLSAINVMALRNTLVEFESKTVKTSADKLVIESVKEKLEKALTELKTEVSKEPVKEEAKDGAILEGGQTMTDTMRRDSRSEAAEESVMSLNLGGAKAEPGIDTNRSASVGGDTEEGVSESSPRERESLLEGKKAEEPVSLLGRLRQGVTGLFGAGGKEGAKAGAAAAESGEAKYEYNQVRFNDFEGNFRGKEDEFNAWLKTQQNTQHGKLTITNGGFGNYPIEFKGGQRIEVSGKDVVMIGFSKVAYERLRDEVFGAATPKSISVSALSGKSLSEIAKSLDITHKPTITSRLASIGLFFQQLGSSIKSFFTGPPTPAQATKSGTPMATAEESTNKSGEKNEVARAPTPTPTPEQRATVGQKRSSESPIAELFEPEKKRQKTASSTAKAIPQWASRTVVTIASNNDLEGIRSAIQEYARNQKFSAIGVDDKSDSIAFQLVDKDGGRLNISAERGKAQVVIVEMKSSKDTPRHIADIATNLPDPGKKDVVVEGRETLKKNVENALKEIGSHNVNPIKEEHVQVTPTHNH